MNSFTTVIYTFKVSKHIIIGQSTNINVFSWLLFSFKLREREWYTKFGYKGKCPQSYLSYFTTGFHWRIFLLIYFRFGVPANHLAPLFFLLVSGDLGKVTKYQHLFIPLYDLHSSLTVTFLTAWYCQFKYEEL